MASPVCSYHAYLATCMLSNMATAARSRLNIKEAAQRVVSGFKQFRGMSYVFSGTARRTLVFPNHSSSDIARGSARNGGINKQSQRFQISQKKFLFRQLKILEESSFVTKFLFHFVFVFTCGGLGIPSWKKGWVTLPQGSTGTVP